MLNSDLQRHVGRFYGKYSGQVTDNQDQDNLGKVKVKVPSVYGPDLEVWARPCLPYAHFMIPAVQVRVWVEFEGGDPQFPIWVGVFYASGEVPPGADVSPPEVRMLKTAAGHRVEYGDKDGEEYVRVKHKNNTDDSSSNDGTLIEFDKDGNVKIAMKDGPLITLKSDKATVAFDDSNVITLESGTAKVKASTISLDGDTIKLGGDSATFKPVEDISLDTLLTMLKTHVHPTAMGPTGPAPALSAAQLQYSSAVKFK